MAKDPMGSRFYMQQGVASSRNNKLKKPTRLKADIVKDIETILKVELTGLTKADKATLEKLHEALCI